MIARFSKCDFWIPEKILDLYRKNPQKNKKFRDQKKLSKSRKYIFRDQQIFENKSHY